MDPNLHLAHLRGADLRAEAAAHRLARELGRRPPVAMRLYSRLWWAARPRAATWSPAPLPSA